MKARGKQKARWDVVQQLSTSGCSWWSRTMTNEEDSETEDAKSKSTQHHAVQIFSGLKPEPAHSNAPGAEKEESPESTEGPQWHEGQKDYSSHLHPQIGSPSLTSLYSGSSEGGGESPAIFLQPLPTGSAKLATAIKTDSIETLKAVMRNMGDAQIAAELTSLSGDELVQSSPIMHAVESGLDMLMVILEQMRAKISREQMVNVIAAKNSVGWTILMEAASSGNAEVLDVIITLIVEELSEDQVVKHIATEDAAGSNVLMVAAYGRIEIFDTVVKVLESKLTPDKVRRMATAATNDGVTNLMVAVTKEMKVFHALMRLFDEKLSGRQMLEMITARSNRGGNVLTRATSRGTDDFAAVVDSLLMRRLTKEQVVEMIAAKDLDGMNVLMVAVMTAASRASTDVFTALLSRLNTRFTAEQVAAMLSAKTFKGRNVLTMASTNHSAGSFEIVVTCLDIVLTEEQVMEMLATRDVNGRNAVMVAVSSGNKEAFNEASKLLEGRNFTEAQVLEVLSTKDNYGYNVLMLAVANGRRTVLDAVIEVLSHMLSESEMLEIVLAKSNSDGTVLMIAALGRGKRLVEAVANLLAGKLNEDKMLEMISAKDVGGMNALMLAATQNENDCVYETLVTRVTCKRTERQVLELFTAKNTYGRNVLALAAVNGSKDAFEAVARRLDNKLTDQQVLGMMRATDNDGLNVLMIAVVSANASRPGFEAVVAYLNKKSTERQAVEAFFLARDQNGDNILAMAACASRDIFNAVAHRLDAALSDRQVLDMVEASNTEDMNILTIPATHGSADVFKSVVDLLEKKLPKEKVVDMITSRHSNGGSILTSAVSSGNAETLSAVVELLDRSVTDDQVREMMEAKHSTALNMLMAAANTGNGAVVQGIVDSANIRLPSDKVAEMLTATDTRGMTAAMIAAEHSNHEALDTILSASMTLLDDQGIDKLTTANNLGETVLSISAKNGHQEALGTILKLLQTRGGDTAVNMVMRTGGGREERTPFHHAAAGCHAAVFDRLLEVCSALPDAKVLGLLAKLDRSGNTILMSSIDGGNMQIIEACVGVMTKRLRGMKVVDTKQYCLTLQCAARSARRVVFEYVEKSLDGLHDIQHKDESSRRQLLKAAIEGGNIHIITVCLGAMIGTASSRDKTTTPAGEGDDDRSTAALHCAAKCGKWEAYLHVVDTLKEKHGVEILNRWCGIPMLQSAAEGANLRIIQECVRAISIQHHSKEDPKAITGRDVSLAIQAAAGAGSWEVFLACFRALNKMHEGKVGDILAGNNGEGSGVLASAVAGRSLGVLNECVAILARRLTDGEMAEKCTAAFDASMQAYCTQKGSSIKEPCGTASIVKPLCVLLEHGAIPTTADLVVLFRESEADQFQDSVLHAVSTAHNPFIPGVTLSVSLVRAAAAAEAPERERRKILSLRERIDELLLEVLERLPQAVQGLAGSRSIEGCSEILEPETMTTTRPTERFVGPLKLALRNPEQADTFCTTPLVQKFLAHKFVSGLPGPRDPDGLVERALNPTNTPEEGTLCHSSPFDAGLLADGSIGRRMQGRRREADCPGDTVLPGLQLALVGIVAKPCGYYEVPALRMALDVVVYLTVLVLYGAVLLVVAEKQGDEAPTLIECLLAIYIGASTMSEGEKMYDRGVRLYFHDKWNVFHLLGLALLLVGFVLRATGNGDVWGLPLYGASAPLLFSGLIFFAQIASIRGPLIQACALVVTMAGFAVSFAVLLREFESPEHVPHTIFRAMLGDTGVFDDVYGEPYGDVAVVLLAAYLITMVTMLLNLLVAVLSAANGNNKMGGTRGGSSGGALKASKAAMIDCYRDAVKRNRLPPPFNAVQFAVSAPFAAVDWWRNRRLLRDRKSRSNTCGTAKRLVGRLVFWLASGPLTIAGGTLLAVISVPNALSTPWMQSRYFGRVSAARRLLLSVIVIPIYLFWVPLALAAFWIAGAGSVLGVSSILTRVRSCCRCRPQRKPVSPVSQPYRFHHGGCSVGQMLRDAPGGRVSVRKLRQYLDDPMSNPHVRQNDVGRPATIEHVTLLRDGLTVKTDGLHVATEQLLANLRGRVEAGSAAMERRLGDMELRLVKRLRQVFEGVAILEQRLGKTVETDFDERIAQVLGDMADKVDSRIIELENKVDALLKACEASPE